MFFSGAVGLYGNDDNGFSSVVKGAVIDIVIGCALLVIGSLATQYDFLPSEVQYGFIGAGAAYTAGTISGLIGLYMLVRNIRLKEAEKEAE